MMSTVTIIVGSPSKSSRLTGMLEELAARLSRRDLAVEWIHVSDLPAEDLMRARFDSPAITEAGALVERSDAVIVASPVYKASYTGVLKAFLDLLPMKGLAGKLTAPAFMGGSAAHLLVMDYAMKPVLSALGATHQLQGVYAVDSQVTRTDNGGYIVAEELAERLDRLAEQVSEGLRGRALPV